jgi:catechol 2,3-dioxygenase-like lactoylglutathione lyase family enzyme
MRAFAPRLHHFATSVADLEATVRWYATTLGFREEHRYEIPGGVQVAFLVLDDVRLEVFEVGGSRAPDPDELALERHLGVRGLRHVALAVDDLDGARAELEDRGVPFLTEPGEVPSSGGERYCFFADPDGVLIELYEPVAAREHPNREESLGAGR